MLYVLYFISLPIQELYLFVPLYHLNLFVLYTVHLFLFCIAEERIITIIKEQVKFSLFITDLFPFVFFFFFLCG